MGEIVNLRTVRKRKARTEAEAEAAANRAKFGRTKSEKARDERAAKLLSQTVDHAKLDEE